MSHCRLRIAHAHCLQFERSGMVLMSRIREASKVTVNSSYFHPAHQHYTENVKEQHILSFLAKQNIKPTVKVFRSRRKRTLSAKINLSSTVCSDVLKEKFWLKHVVCKPWRSKMKDKLERSYSAQVTQLGKNSTLV